MPWNYRVIKRDYMMEQDIHGYTRPVYTQYAIYEVYYKNGNIVVISKEPVQPAGDTFDELRNELRQMFVDALGKPILDYDNIEFGDWEDERLTDEKL